MLFCAFQAQALSLNLDSIAEWGKFPRFCINTYRWGDGFFNGYDTTYVKGTGYKFNAKLRTESWIDSYNFFLPDRVRMQMYSDPSTSTGIWLSYLAVSLGFDKNVSKYVGGTEQKRRNKFTFGFNCSLFAVNLYYSDNTGATRITRFGPPGLAFNPKREFDGMRSRALGIDSYYFFNHKKYSQAAAFSFSRVQTQSQGSWFAGASYRTQNYNFDFNELPQYMKEALPESWVDYRYKANTKNIALKGGYGYNWVFAPKWTLGIQESPTVGLKIGTINAEKNKKTGVTFNNQLRASVVWNHKQWFAAAVGVYDTALIYDKDAVFQNSEISATVLVGFRFNLW